MSGAAEEDGEDEDDDWEMEPAFDELLTLDPLLPSPFDPTFCPLPPATFAFEPPTAGLRLFSFTASCIVLIVEPVTDPRFVFELFVLVVFVLALVMGCSEECCGVLIVACDASEIGWKFAAATNAWAALAVLHPLIASAAR